MIDELVALPEQAARGAVLGAAIAIAVRAVLSKTMRAACGQLYLAVRCRTPFRLLRFLEDARSRHILRIVSPIYRFRQATLQDHLAGRETQPTPPESATSPERPKSLID